MTTKLAEIKLTLESIPEEMSPENELLIRNEAYQKLDLALEHIFNKEPLSSSINS